MFQYSTNADIQNFCERGGEPLPYRNFDSINQRILSFTNYIIDKYSKFKNDTDILLDKMDDNDKYDFSILLFESYDREFIPITENKDSDDIASELINCLATPTRDNDIAFVDLLKLKITEYFRPHMKEIIEERLSEPSEYSFDNDDTF